MTLRVWSDGRVLHRVGAPMTSGPKSDNETRVPHVQSHACTLATPYERQRIVSCQIEIDLDTSVRSNRTRHPGLKATAYYSALLFMLRMDSQPRLTPHFTTTRTGNLTSNVWDPALTPCYVTIQAARRFRVDVVVREAFVQDSGSNQFLVLLAARKQSQPPAVAGHPRIPSHHTEGLSSHNLRTTSR